MCSMLGAEEGSLLKCVFSFSPLSTYCRPAHASSHQSLARLGANTLAIDAAAMNITVAQTHASLDPSLHVLNSPLSSPSSPSTPPRNTLEYRHSPAEELVKEGRQFDVVCAVEVIEHVEDPRGFLDCLGELLKVRLFCLFCPACPSS
jgi:2-polyprenyl-3-methyl-5-hydroxy-6-metoxy-1,4-benzoquinol methylase